MAQAYQLANRVKLRRQERGWSQDALARRTGISRAAVSAIEVNRLVPSVAAALSLATAFGCTVEDLFGFSTGVTVEPGWAWPPDQASCRYWHARVQERIIHYPVEATAAGEVAHDGVFTQGSFIPSSEADPATTLVMASCDPAAGLLAAEYARSSGFRLLVLARSSRQALTLLGHNLVHVAGVHFATGREPDGNLRAAKEILDNGFRLLRIARWQEGLAFASGLGIRSIRGALRFKLRWVGREAGSAARQCLDELLAERQPRRLARDHRGVAEAVRCGWADLGVCLRLASEEAGLRFLSVREECYDLCYAAAAEADPRIQALLRVVRSSAHRRLFDELPGYDSTGAGEVSSVN